MQGNKLGMSTKLISRIITFTCLTLTTLSSMAMEPVPVRENKLIVGGGAAHHSMVYTGLDSITKGTPLFEVQFGPFFAFNKHDEPTIGLELFRHKRVMLALGVIYGDQFLDVSEVDVDKNWLYLGIEDRDKATEGALIFHFYSKVGLVDITVARDISNTYDDFRSSISWSRPFPETGNWTIVPRMYGRYYSIKYNDYYFGVSQSEMDRAEQIHDSEGIQIEGTPVSFEDYEDKHRPAYKAGNAGQFGVDLTIDYNFTENLMARGYIGLEQLAGQVTSSPLIEDADIWRLSLGLAYKF